MFFYLFIYLTLTFKLYIFLNLNFTKFDCHAWHVSNETRFYYACRTSNRKSCNFLLFLHLLFDYKVLKNKYKKTQQH